MRSTTVRLSAALALAAMLSACSQPEVAAGPPCPSVDAAAFAAFPNKPKGPFAYSGVVYARALGNADCTDVTSGPLGFSKYQTCDFTSPAALDVTLENGQHRYYTPGLGKAVRVSIRKGEASCEMVAR